MTEKSFFGRTEFKFTEVNLEGGVNVPQFLNACRSYVAFYDLFGQMGLYILKLGYLSNIILVRVNGSSNDNPVAKRNLVCPSKK